MKEMLSNEWQELLIEEFNKPYFIALTLFVENQYNKFPNTTFPKKKDLFNALNACKPEDVKVVIIGQDPYPTKGHANGLCFSVSPHVTPLPRSLNNIYKELEDDCDKFPSKNGDLTHWANQGVLLINNVLSVSEGLADSHANKGWEQFTDAIIRQLSISYPNLVYFLWGSKAKSKGQSIKTEFNCILEAPHPSPLSAYRGFFGCKHFSKANDYLKSVNKTPIQW
jgi:uracil-DNA glycosylase